MTPNLTLEGPHLYTQDIFEKSIIPCQTQSNPKSLVRYIFWVERVTPNVTLEGPHLYTQDIFQKSVILSILLFLTHGKPITCYIKLHSDINHFIHQPHLTNQVHISPFVLLLSHHSPLLETSIFAHCHHISYLVVFIQSLSPPECG